MAATLVQTDTSRAATLRRRYLQRKKSAEYGLYTHLAKAQSLQRTCANPWLALRFGQKVRDILESLAFEVDDQELLMGRLRSWPRAQVAPETLAAADSFLSHFPWSGGQTGHCALDYPTLFRLGVGGLRQQAQDAAAALDEADPEQQARLHFYRSADLALAGFSSMVLHASETARRAAADCTEPQRRLELERMADACEQIAIRPPRMFHEAIQLLWFAMESVMFGDEAGLVVPGRLDRVLWPFFQADLAAGRITEARALELIECLYVLINELIPDGLAMSVMVGGRDAAGRDSTNRLSYLSLEALRRTKLCYPTVGICWHPGTPPDLAALAVQLIAGGTSTPAFFGDEVITGGLRQLGVPPEDACNYINSTCVEITPVGGSNVWVASPYFNLCGTLLEMIREIAAGTVTAPGTYAEFLQDYMRRMGERIRAAVVEQNSLRETRHRFMARPLQSAFTRDCLGRGLDIERGGARYNWIECSFVGLANLVDALHVLEQEVLGPAPALSFRQLQELLSTDFAGNESVRQRFLHKYPKYGNGQEEVDRGVRRILESLAAECRKYRVRLDAPFVPGAFCWIMHEVLGRDTGATPDGRRAGFPFADGTGPAQGREKHGPTAAILSVTSWCAAPLIGGSAFNMKFNASVFATPGSADRLQELVLTFLQRGGFEVQINVVNREELLKAQQDPEAYADLVVRIGGYTDYFVRLSPGMQAEVMARTAYECV